MTPDRAAFHFANESGQHGGPAGTIIAAILAACAEERRAALTEAAEACRSEMAGGSFIEYDSGCVECAAAIERIRDKPNASSSSSVVSRSPEQAP